MIEVLASGPLSTVQDLGRAGYRGLGVASAGAFDRAALLLGNRLVGNSPDCAVIEVTLGGLAFVVHDAVTVALTGAACAGIDWGTAVSLGTGSTVRLDAPASGLRSYLAVRGGIALLPELGSRSTDTLSGLGPAPLRAGDRLPVGAPPRNQPSEAAAVPVPAPAALRVVPGPREDWFVPGSREVLVGTRWGVSADANRIGIRLDGPALARAQEGELPSEPMLPGAIQVPPHGRPIVFGPDAPVTGGYPVIGVLTAAGLDATAQLRPGDTVRFAV